MVDKYYQQKKYFRSNNYVSIKNCWKTKLSAQVGFFFNNFWYSTMSYMTSFNLPIAVKD